MGLGHQKEEDWFPSTVRGFTTTLLNSLISPLFRTCKAETISLFPVEIQHLTLFTPFSFSCNPPSSHFLLQFSILVIGGGVEKKGGKRGSNKEGREKKIETEEEKEEEEEEETGQISLRRRQQLLL